VKRLLSIFLIIGLVISMTSMVSAEIRVTLDGAPIAFDVPPQAINDRTMVPLRAIFEALNANIDWDDNTQTVTATRDGVVVVMRVGDPVITVAGNEITLDVPPQIVDDRTLVPARAVAESFGLNVDWNGETQTVVLATGSMQSYDVVSANEFYEELTDVDLVIQNYWKLKIGIIEYMSDNGCVPLSLMDIRDYLDEGFYPYINGSGTSPLDYADNANPPGAFYSYRVVIGDRGRDFPVGQLSTYLNGELVMSWES